jgi:hypothetical protein
MKNAGFVRTMNLITTAMFRDNFATSRLRDRSLQRESPFQRDKIRERKFCALVELLSRGNCRRAICVRKSIRGRINHGKASLSLLYLDSADRSVVGKYF